MPLLIKKRINIIHDFQNVNSNISFFDKKYFFFAVLLFGWIMLFFQRRIKRRGGNVYNL